VAYDARELARNRIEWAVSSPDMARIRRRRLEAEIGHDIRNASRQLLRLRPTRGAPSCSYPERVPVVGGDFLCGRTRSAPGQRFSEQASEQLVVPLGDRDVESPPRTAVQLRRSAGPATRPARKPAVFGSQQAGLYEAVQVECSHRSADSNGRGRLVTVHRTLDMGDVPVELFPCRF
jgi:hypothetical protein